MQYNIFDLHCDTLSALWERERRGERVSLAKNDLHIDLAKLREGGYVGQVFAAFVNTAREADPYAAICEQIRLFERIASKNRRLYHVKEAADLRRAQAAGSLAAVLAVEDAGVTCGEIERIEELHRMGVRLMTLTWNHPNAIGTPNDVGHNLPKAEDRLTPIGVEAVRAMERLGMAIDVSHLSDGGFYDVLAHTACPVLASHSCARNRCDHVRNLTDDMIYQIARRGGVVGVNYYDAFLCRGRCADMGDVVAHIKHMVKVGGVDVVALGSDFDGIPTSGALPTAAYLPNLCTAMEHAGFTSQDIAKITSESAKRFFASVLP